MNEIDICRQFSFAIESAGLMVPEHIVADGVLHRFAPNGSPNKKDAWYVLHADGIPAGAFGDWRTSVTETWVADIGRRLTPTEINSHKERAEKAKIERDQIRQAEYARAANHAKEIWESAKPAPFDHAYLIAKQIKPHGLRVYKGALVVPIRGDRGLMSLQYIGGDGIKWMLTGGAVGGGYFDLGGEVKGGAVDDVVCIAEGFATAASICEATGYPVRVALSAGNLLRVGKILRGLYPSARIIYCADDDHLTSGNPGLTKAREAAVAVGATVVSPRFDAPRPGNATDFNDMAVLHGREAVSELINGHKQKELFPGLWVHEGVIEDNPKYYIKGLIDHGASAMIYGPSGDGKTFFAIDMMLKIATGQPWRDRRVKPGLVVYVASEAGSSIVRRFVAWRNSNSAGGFIPLYIITRGPNLMNADDVAALKEKIKLVAAEAKLPVGIIVFDTLSRSTAGADENSTKEMSALIGVGDHLRDSIGAAVLYVHHAGKNAASGARGSSAIHAACDLVIKVEKRVALIEKSRDGVSGSEYPFDLKMIDLGVDSDGDPINTCLVLDNNTTAQQKAKPPTGANQVIVYDAIKNAILLYGQVMPGTSAIPAGVVAVEVEVVVNIVKQKMPLEENTKYARQKIARAMDSLFATKNIGIEGKYVWIW